jgi:hypothetical protein
LLTIPFYAIIYLMAIEQTVEIPANRRITLEVPKEVPTGTVILTFTPVTKAGQKSDMKLPPSYSPEEALAIAARRHSGQNRPPISQYFGIISSGAFGDGVQYQRQIRDEWDG